MKELWTCSIFLLIFFSLTLFSSLALADTTTTSVDIELSECSDGIDNDGDLRIDFPNDPECDSLLDDNENTTGVETSATITILSSGGTFSHTNNDGLNTDFNFPQDFNTTSTRVFVNTYSNTFFKTSKPAPSDREFIGKTYNFNLYRESDGQQVTSLNKKTSVTLRYKESDIKSGTDESSYSPYRWDNTDSSWNKISDFSLDTAANKITFSTDQFSPFSILGNILDDSGGGDERRVTECSDGIDNDGNGLWDFPDDPGCNSDEDNSEFTPPPTREPTRPDGEPGRPSIPDVEPEAPREPLEPELEEEREAVQVGDLNGDGFVNLRDLSILLYYADRPDLAPHFADLNGDDSLDLKDISILLFYWA